VQAPSDPAFDGKSLLPLLKGATTSHHEVLYWNSGPPKGEWAVRKGTWKAHGYQETVELYDLSADPSESRNRAAQHPEMARELVQLHATWLKEMMASAGEGQRSNAQAKPERKQSKVEREKIKAERKRSREKRKEDARLKQEGDA